MSTAVHAGPPVTPSPLENRPFAPRFDPAVGSRPASGGQADVGPVLDGRVSGVGQSLACVDEHRRPGEESVGLYPGLVVSDGEHSRQSGSITVGRTRLPLWAFIGDAVRSGWGVTGGYYDEGGEYERTFGRDAAGRFVSALADLRGEFGRLLLLLADPRWQTQKRRRKQLAVQMRRCLAKLEEVKS